VHFLGILEELNKAIAFATKNSKIYNIGLSTIQELIRSLLFQWVII
jgi:hypothetical protein